MTKTALIIFTYTQKTEPPSPCTGESRSLWRYHPLDSMDNLLLDTIAMSVNAFRANPAYKYRHTDSVESF